MAYHNEKFVIRSHIFHLLNNLTPEMRSAFQRHMFHKPGAVYTHINFSDWLQYESWCQDEEGPLDKVHKDQCNPRLEKRKEQGMTPKSYIILHGSASVKRQSTEMETKTVQCHATPLLRKNDMPKCETKKKLVMPFLR